MGTVLQTLNERIAERVGKELIDLMPADEWKQIINKTVTQYKTEVIPKIILEILTENLKIDIARKLHGAYYTDQWNATVNKMTNEAVKDMLIKSVPEIFAAMLEPVTSGLMQDLRNRMQNY